MLNLKEVKDNLGNCRRCKLSTTRNNIVFGQGDPDAVWMFVGEAPGAKEDLKGVPFIGKAGELLNKMISASGWSRGSVYVSNVVMCRPPNNRDPQDDEIETCKPFLLDQIKAIAPKVITTLGKQAANLLLDCNEPLYKLRGNKYKVLDSTVIPTYHPSYIQRGNWSKLQLMRNDFVTALVTLVEHGHLPPNWQ